MSPPTTQTFSSLVKAVQRSQRQLALTNIPVRLSAEHLRQSEANVNQLETRETDNLDDAVTILIQTAGTRALIKHVLKCLNICDPVYACAADMQRDAGLARSEIAKRVEAAMKRGDIVGADRQRCRTVLVVLLDGEDLADFTGRVERMLVGLLRGTKPQDLLRECPPDTKDALSRLLDQIKYKELSNAVGPLSQMKGLAVPAIFRLQTYNAGGGGGSARVSVGASQVQPADIKASATDIQSKDVLLQRVDGGEEIGNKEEKGRPSAATRRRARNRATRAERMRAEEKAAKSREASRNAPTYQSPF